jgi:N-acetylmuramoyl-L-alanine amidase
VRRAPAVAALLLTATCLLGVERPRGLSDVADLRHWSYPDYTRIVVETTRPVTLSSDVKHLPADAAAGRPERLYIDLEGLWVGTDHLDGVRLSDGLLQGFRLGQFTLEKTRLVLDLERYQRHRLLQLTHPDRVVIDVYGRRGGALSPALLPPPLRPVRTVVLDPGHGGRDPGAIGVRGLREKDVNLRIARALGRELEERGFRVIYTRNDDRSLDLEQRTAIAEGSDGDLYVSIHANAARRRSVRGIETYYLDENHERHALTVAARENGIPRHQVNALQRTLAKLRVSELSPHSKRLATMVHQEVISGMPRRYREPDLGVKKGPFYVLFLSSMPAILIETGFLTNREDAKRLRSADYHEAVAERIAIGLSQYRDHQTRLARRSTR